MALRSGFVPNLIKKGNKKLLLGVGAQGQATLAKQA